MQAVELIDVYRKNAIFKRLHEIGGFMKLAELLGVADTETETTEDLYNYEFVINGEHYFVYELKVMIYDLQLLGLSNPCQLCRHEMYELSSTLKENELKAKEEGQNGLISTVKVKNPNYDLNKESVFQKPFYLYTHYDFDFMIKTGIEIESNLKEFEKYKQYIMV